MLDFRVDTFLNVCKYMNFTKAAEAMNITQPAVSQHIHYLEEAYGVKLFDYKGKKLRLTEAGSLLFQAAMTLKHDDLHIRGQIQEMKKGIKKLNFGVTLTVGEYLLPDRIAAYAKIHPELSIQMAVANTSELLKKMDSGEIDFALVEGFFAKSDYDYIKYSTEEYIAVCGAGYEFRHPVSKLEDTLSECLITREIGSGSREILERCLEGRNLTVKDYRNVMEIGNIKAIKTLVRENCGITFLYRAAVEKEIRSGQLKKIEMDDFHMTHDVNFLWRKNSIFAGYYEELFGELQGIKPE